MERRGAARGSTYVLAGGDGLVPEPVLRWQSAVHDPGIYDLEVDTSRLSASDCADRILRHVDEHHPTAFQRINDTPHP